MSVDFNTANVYNTEVFTEAKSHSVVYWVTALFSLADEYSHTRQPGGLFVYYLFNVTIRLYNVRW
jgi:hypothetical protein